MLQSTNIPPETNYIPSGERWEYARLKANSYETFFEFLNRVGSDGWEMVYYNPVGLDTKLGIFKRKLIANK